MLKKENFLIFLCNRANNSHDEKNKKGAFHMKQLIILLTILFCIMSCHNQYEIKPEITKELHLFDLDEDNVPNDKDECPSTPAGVNVTENGCADEDDDGIQDINDKCKGTPKDAKINKFGCSDSDDDGVSDKIDECPNTEPDIQVNHLGCPDDDGDGIKNSIDKCANTPKNVIVNKFGCQDDDQDGIEDSIDKCLETPFGYTINSNGCSENDNDHDGVPFYLDKCPSTPYEFEVDDNGCKHILDINENMIDVEPIHRLYINSNAISYSSDGRYIAYISHNSVIVVYISSMKHKVIFKNVSSGIKNISFTFNNKYLCIVTHNRNIVFINVSTWKENSRVEQQRDYYYPELIISPQGNYIGYYNNRNFSNKLKIIHAKNGKVLMKPEDLGNYDSCIPVFSYDELYLSVRNHIYEVESLNIIADVKGTPTGFTQDNQYYITSSHIYKVGTWDVVSYFGGDLISADSRYLVKNNGYRNSELFEIESLNKIQKIENNIINFSEKWIFCSTNDRILILDKSNLDINYLYNGFKRLDYELQANQLAVSYNKIEFSYKNKYVAIFKKKIQEINALSSEEMGEFETKNEYKLRIAKRKFKYDSITNTFNNKRKIFRKERVNKRMKLIEQYNEKLNNLLITSRKPIDDLKVSFEKYRADGKYFPVYISHDNVIPFNGIVRVSRANARTFKKSIDQLSVRAEVQPTINNRKKLVNIVIHNPNTGNSYYLAKTESHKSKHIPVPPNLKATVKFNEPSGNNALDAEETGNIVVEIQNIGKGSAFQVATRLVASSAIRDLDYPSEKIIPEISPTSTQQVIFPLKSGLDIPEQKALLTVEFDEKNGFPPDPVRIKFQTRQLLQPKLEIVDYIIDDSSKDGKIQQEEVVKTTFRIQNRGQGTAREVIAKVTFGPNVFQALNVPMEYDIGSVKPNDIKEFKVAFYTNQRIKNKLPLTVELFEERPRFNFSKPFAFKMNVKEKTVFETIVKAKAQKIIQISDITSPSDIDRNIPKTGISVQGVAVVIGNYDYQKVPKVEFARRDAAIMAEYLKQVFGFPSENVITIQDATLANMIDVFGSKGMATKSKISNYFSKGDEIFIYYTGHGAPGLRDKKGYLVPVDANPDNIETTGYSLETLYSNLDQINARKKTIVIDACFSGESQSGSLFKNASPMYIKADLGHLTNGTIITSSSGKQMASWYPEKRHSIFTYFFLKGVKNSAAKNEPITYKQLQQYVSGAVNKISKKLYSRIQEPQFSGNLSQEVFNIKTSDQ